MSAPLWQFWIDVGGTFTDCLVRRPDGAILRYKLLSSGVTKGSIGECFSRLEILDPRRQSDPADFYSGYQFRLLDDNGACGFETTVDSFDAPAGRLRLRNELPENLQPGQPYELTTDEESPNIAIRYLLGLPRREPIPPVAIRLGTTRGTNALLTRSGAPTALVTTTGFGDVLRIGYQNRPRLFDLTIKKHPPLFDAVVEIDERVSADGDILRSPDADKIRRQLAALRRDRPEICSLAVCLLNAYKFAEHEQLVERLAREIGFEEVSVSSRIAPLIKLVSRGDTTVVDAYLNPVLREYIASLRGTWRGVGLQTCSNEEPGTGRSGDLPHTTFRILTSAGGLVDAEQFVGKDSILSGPAGGVVGFAAAAEAAGFSRAIGLDMGGTSTDVSRWDGRFEREYETEKAGVRIVAPMMAIETVAAGGGSICYFDGVKLCVGPQSAGTSPGPACYGGGGPLTVTDVNLALGKILPEHFPFQLDRTVVELRLAELINEIAAATGRQYEPLGLADGFLRIANANMAQAIRSVSIAKGCDPRDYVLVAFGGAAGQHACAIAQQLGIRQILSHPDAGILSAYGIGMANVERSRVEGIYRPLPDVVATEMDDIFRRLTESAENEVLAEGIGREQIEIECSLDLRYAGLDAFLTIGRPADGGWRAAYAREHEKLYGYRHDDRPLEVVAARVTAIGHSGEKPPASQRVGAKRSPEADSTTVAHFAGTPQVTNAFHRHALKPGDHIIGPAIVLEKNATTIVDPGWQAEMLSDGQMIVEQVSRPVRVETEARVSDRSPDPCHERADPALLEIFNNHFAAIAEQMGITLRNTSSSVNVKERLDFSCAVFTPAGELVVNAPHIPVHLGAMGLTVRGVLEDNPDMQPGDVFVTNDPYRGGSHLPDITVVTPVFKKWGRSPDLPELLFFTASRAHHAEIGGVRAGSMPPFSTNLAEEGVLIRNFKIVVAGISRMDAFRTLLLSPPTLLAMWMTTPPT